MTEEVKERIGAEARIKSKKKERLKRKLLETTVAIISPFLRLNSYERVRIKEGKQTLIMLKRVLSEKSTPSSSFYRI